MPRRSWAVRSAKSMDRQTIERGEKTRQMRYEEGTTRGNGTIAEEDGRQIGEGDGNGREIKERESGQRLGNNRPRRKIHENLFLISWPIAVYIYAQYGRVRVILLAI